MKNIFLKSVITTVALFFVFSLSAQNWGLTGNNIHNLNTGSVGIGTNSPNANYKLTIQGDTYSNGWIRTTGTKGLFFQSYGGGFYMKDATWIRTYGNKSFYHNTGTFRTDGTFQVGVSGSRFRVSTNGNVGVGITNPTSKLHVNGRARITGGLDVHVPRNTNSDLNGINTTYGEFNNVQITGTGWGNSHAILFNAYKRKEPLSGSFQGFRSGEGVLFSVDSGQHSNGAGGIVFEGNSGRMDFYISDKSAGINRPVSWKEPKMRIDRNGSVGIGTGTGAISAKLHVNGTAMVSDKLGIGVVPSAAYKLNVQNSSSAFVGNARFYNTSSRNGTTYGIYNYLYNTGTGTKYGIQSYVDGNGNGTLYGIHARVDGNDNYALWAQATSNDSHAALFDGAVDIRNAELNIYNTNTDAHFIIYPQWDASSPNGNFINITPVENGVERFDRSTKFHEDGSLTKRIDKPDSKALVVSLNDNDNFVVMGSGKVYARDVEVSLDPFPDYVFEEDYNLIPLKELGEYVKTKKHLPNMPSAEEVKENGMGLKELNIKQTEKIEELTLYILQLDERLKKLELENQKLKGQR